MSSVREVVPPGTGVSGVADAMIKAIPTVCLDVTSLAVGIYGYDDGKTGRLVAHSLVLHMGTDRGHTERQEGLYQQHAQPVAHVESMEMLGVTPPLGAPQPSCLGPDT